MKHRAARVVVDLGRGALWAPEVGREGLDSGARIEGQIGCAGFAHDLVLARVGTRIARVRVMPTKPLPKQATKTSPRTLQRQTDDDNVVRQAQTKGKVRPDGPGDATAPVKPDRRARH